MRRRGPAEGPVSGGPGLGGLQIDKEEWSVKIHVGTAWLTGRIHAPRARGAVSALQLAQAEGLLPVTDVQLNLPAGKVNLPFLALRLDQVVLVGMKEATPDETVALGQASRGITLMLPRFAVRGWMVLPVGARIIEVPQLRKNFVLLESARLAQMAGGASMGRFRRLAVNTQHVLAVTDEDPEFWAGESVDSD